MGLVDDHQEVVREVVEQAARTLARRAAREVARVVLDPLAGAGRGEHLEIVLGALLEPLRLEQLARGTEARELFAQLRADAVERGVDARLGRDEMLGRVEREALHAALRLPGHRVHGGQPRHHLVLQLDAHDHVVVGGVHLDHVAPHPEASAPDLDVVALVLDRDQALEQVLAAHRLAGGEIHAQVLPVRGGAEAVDARHARHHHRLVLLEQHRGRLQAQPVDVVVDAGVLGDVGVGRRDVGLGLVVVVVRDEVAHRVLGEELLELPVELRRQRLVVRDHQRRASPLGDHVGDGERLARPGDPEQDLAPLATTQAVGQRGDGLGLVAARRVWGTEGVRHGPPMLPEARRAVEGGLGHGYQRTRTV